MKCQVCGTLYWQPLLRGPEPACDCSGSAAAEPPVFDKNDVVCHVVWPGVSYIVCAISPLVVRRLGPAAFKPTLAADLGDLRKWSLKTPARWRHGDVAEDPTTGVHCRITSVGSSGWAEADSSGVLEVPPAFKGAWKLVSRDGIQVMYVP